MRAASTITYDPSGLPVVQRGSTITIEQAARFAEEMFTTFAVVQLITILVLIPALFGGAIADEKQRKTLHYLMASQLSSFEIVVDKVLGRAPHVAVFLAVGLPVVCLLGLFGGVAPESVAIAYVGTFSTASMAVAMTVLLSTLARKVRQAVLVAYILLLAWQLRADHRLRGGQPALSGDVLVDRAGQHLGRGHEPALRLRHDGDEVEGGRRSVELGGRAVRVDGRAPARDGGVADPDRGLAAPADVPPPRGDPAPANVVREQEIAVGPASTLVGPARVRRRRDGLEGAAFRQRVRPLHQAGGPAGDGPGLGLHGPGRRDRRDDPPGLLRPLERRLRPLGEQRGAGRAPAGLSRPGTWPSGSWRSRGPRPPAWRSSASRTPGSA